MGEPVAIDPGTQELAYFPLIYWPVTDNTPVIRPDTAAKLNSYPKSGGTILFDTRDQGGANFGTERLEEIAKHLNVLPPLRGGAIGSRAYTNLLLAAGISRSLGRGASGWRAKAPGSMGPLGHRGRS